MLAVFCLPVSLFANSSHPLLFLKNAFALSAVGGDSAFSLPFSRSGNLIFIKARADTTEGNFILDTGCPGLVLNQTYFRHYPSFRSQEIESQGVNGSFGDVLHTTVKNFSFGNSRHRQLEADLVNLGHIENSRGIKVLGLIGLQLLTQFEMIIDFEKNTIHFRETSRKEPPGVGHHLLADTASYSTVPVELKDDRIMVKTEIAGKKLSLLIDSGAEINILDSRLPDKVFEQVAITGRVSLNGTGNKPVDALKAELSLLQIGQRRMENVPILIANLEKTCFSHGGCVDGVLGFENLSATRIGFNFVTGKMYIWK